MNSVVLILQKAASQSDSEGDTNDDELSTLLKGPNHALDGLNVERHNEGEVQVLKWAKTVHPARQLAQRKLLDNWDASVQRVDLLCQGVDRALTSQKNKVRAICAAHSSQSEPSLNCAAIAAKYGLLHHNLDRVAVFSDQADACREALGGDENFFLVEPTLASVAAMSAWNPQLVVCDSEREDVLSAVCSPSLFEGPVAVLVKRVQAARLMRSTDGKLLPVEEIDEAEEESTYNPKRMRTVEDSPVVSKAVKEAMDAAVAHVAGDEKGKGDDGDEEQVRAADQSREPLPVEEAKPDGGDDDEDEDVGEVEVFEVSKKRSRSASRESSPSELARRGDSPPQPNTPGFKSDDEVRAAVLTPSTVGVVGAVAVVERQVGADKDDVVEGESAAKRGRVQKRTEEEFDEDDEDDDGEAGEVDILADGEDDSQEGSGRDGVDIDYDNSERSFTEIDRPRVAPPLPALPVAFATPAAVVLDTDELDMDEINALIGEELGSNAV